MLVFCIGDDVVRAKAEVLKRTRGSEVVRVGEGGEPLESALGYLEQLGMFTRRVALIIDRPMDSAEGKEYMLEHAETFAASDTQVFVIQQDVDVVTKKKLEKLGTVEVYDLPHTRELVSPPNSFELVDAVQAGDRKRAWILYRQCMANGASAEEVHGTLAWAARGVVLASKTKNADEAGMKSFPYDKAKRVARTLTPALAEAQSAELVALYHDARMGRGSLEDLLEVYLLRK